MLTHLQLVLNFLPLLCLQFYVAEATKTTFTFGYLHMASPSIDSPNTLAGYQAMIRQANENNYYPQAHFVLNVTTIDCRSPAACNTLALYQNQQFDAFLDAMTGFTAVLKPNSIVSTRIAERAHALGSVVIDDAGFRDMFFERDYEHMINFGHKRSRIADHLFTYMQLKLNCAYSGIMHGTLVPGMEADHYNLMYHIQRLFDDAGHSTPPFMNIQTATDAQLADFVMNDEPRRRCFIVSAANAVFLDALTRLGKMPSYSPRKYFYLGFNMAATDSYLINGTTNLTSQLTIAQWSPPDVSPAVRNAFGVWKSSPLAADLQAFAPAETIPTTIEFFTVQASLVIRLAMEVISTVASKSASLAHSSCNSSGQSAVGPPIPWVGPPIPWANITEGFYQGGRVIDGYKFASLVRSCPIQPQKQICYCSSLTQTSYIYEVNSTTGKLQVVYDDVDGGEREVASLEFPNFCGYEASSWSYPITGVVVFPSYATGSSSMRNEDVIEAVDLYRSVYRALTNDINYATVKHPRSFRYEEVSADEGQLNTTVFEEYLGSVKPFIMFGSMAERINRSDVLTLVPSLMEIETEDPVLVPHGTGTDGWQWNVLQLEPSLADLIHGLVAYFADVMSNDDSGLNALDSKAKFTSIHALASTQREAELISMSFATWGYNVLVADVVVSDIASVWAERTSSWLSNAKSSNPFVLVASAANPNAIITTAAVTAATANKGTTAMACSTSAMRSIASTVTFPPSSAKTSDVIFGSTFGDYWMSRNTTYPESVAMYSYQSRFQRVYLTMRFAEQLANEVWYDYQSTAAQVLYSKATITASNMAFGPFSNSTCRPSQIASNTRDRTCQCTKGARSVFVNSLRARIAETYSEFTGRFTWTMSTCGVVYTPYVPPADEPSSLSSGAIAGIAIGGSVLLFAATAGYILSVCFVGRNNRNAPKDPTKPFAVVFTDIQSSTALWSRAPAAMSDAIEYHHELMRKTLRRNNGYEVKTVGDSFMIAFHEADDAVRFTLEAQVAFNEGDWNPEIDAIYIELLAEAAESDAHDTINEKQTVTVDGPTEKSYVVSVFNNHAPKNAQSTMNESQLLDRSLSSQSPRAIGHSTTVSICQLVDSEHPFQAFNPQLGKRLATSVSSLQSSFVSEEPGFANYEWKKIQHVSPSKSNPNMHHYLANDPGVASLVEGVANCANFNPLGEHNDHVIKGNISFHSGGSDIEPSNPSMWHGLRVRMGVHFGMGDIRKDAVTLGYDYYGTVVNVAARVEGVGHGGQTLVTEEAYSALSHTFKDDAVVIALGHQPLRGLDAPVKLFQFLPSQLNLRKFPQLRLHIEKETEDTSTTNTGTATASANETDAELLESTVHRLFANNKQYQMTSPDEVLYNYHFLTAIFAPVKEKFRNSVNLKLAESWGYDKSAINAGMSNGNANKLRFFVNFVAKMTKTFVVGGRRSGNIRRLKRASALPGATTIDTRSGSSRDSGGRTTGRRQDNQFLYQFSRASRSSLQSQKLPLESNASIVK